MSCNPDGRGTMRLKSSTLAMLYMALYDTHLLYMVSHGSLLSQQLVELSQAIYPKLTSSESVYIILSWIDSNSHRFTGSIWYPILGTQCLIPSIWYLALGTRYWYLPSTWCQLPGAWYQKSGTKYLVPGTWYQALGPDKNGTKYVVPIFGRKFGDTTT